MIVTSSCGAVELHVMTPQSLKTFVHSQLLLVYMDMAADFVECN